MVLSVLLVLVVVGLSGYIVYNKEFDTDVKCEYKILGITKEMKMVNTSIKLKKFLLCQERIEL